MLPLDPPVPYLDLAGYKRRSRAPGNVDVVAAMNPGFVERMIEGGSSRINSRLAKRYRVPLGKDPPPLMATGTAPPPVTLTGRPMVGSLEIVLQITAAGALGVAFKWSIDGGQTFPNTATTAPTVALTGTGLTANFSPGPYAADNLYSAPSPVPAIALDWLARIVDVDVWDARGTNPQDPKIARYVEAKVEALAELKEAADSDVGLFDLPQDDVSGGDAVVFGGPLCYSEQSPYVWADAQAVTGRQQDPWGHGQ